MDAHGARDAAGELVGDRGVERLARVAGDERDGLRDPGQAVGVEAGQRRVGERARPLPLEERPGPGRQAVPRVVAGDVPEEGLGRGRAAPGIERPLRVACDAPEPRDAARDRRPARRAARTRRRHSMRSGRRAAASSPITPPNEMPTTLAAAIPRASR